MRTLVDHLAHYAAYHRDRRNIVTHFVGIPMIVLAVQALLARAVWSADAAWPISAAELVTGLAVLFYLRLDRRLGLLMALLLGAGLWGAHALAALPRTQWLGWSIGLFVVGWVAQAIGHLYEGRKPAFFDDLRGLVIGPLFLAAEAVFALGGRRALAEAVGARAVEFERGLAPRRQRQPA